MLKSTLNNMKTTITPFNYPEDSDNYRGLDMKIEGADTVTLTNTSGNFTNDLFLHLHFLRRSGIKLKPQVIELEIEEIDQSFASLIR